jgi:protein CpxP
MSEQPDSPNPDSTGRRRWWRRVFVIGSIGSIAGLGAAGWARAHGGWRGGWHGGGFYDADPQTMQRRAEAMVQYWLADIDASEAQQKRIAEIMTTTMRELRPLREQHREARKQVMEILSKPQIDRGALEAIRQNELQRAEQFSRRITQSLADAAETLSVEQRTKLAERIAQRRERWHRGRG